MGHLDLGHLYLGHITQMKLYFEIFSFAQEERTEPNHRSELHHEDAVSDDFMLQVWRK